MSPSTGRGYLAIPGPSVMPDRVLQAMQRAAPNIYGTDLRDLTVSLLPDLRAVARTDGHVAIYIANGHGVWEAALANTLAPGDHVLCLATGFFGHGWARMAKAHGAAVEVMDFGTQAPVDAARVADRLAQDTGHAIRAVLVSHVDTATALRNDIAALHAALGQTGHPALLMVDCIASLGCDRFEMDAWGVDVMVAASQKGLMTPPGMGFVFFNDRAGQVRARQPLVSEYWDWAPRANPQEFSQYFGGTAPTHLLFALREALTMLVQEEGVQAAWARHTRLARAIWAAAQAWGSDPGVMRLNVDVPENRSHAVTALSLPPPHATALRDWTESRMGLTLGVGLGMAPPGTPEWHGHFRIGHMGHLNGHMVMGLLGSIEAGLVALNIPHGPHALQAAAEVLAAPGP